MHGTGHKAAFHTVNTSMPMLGSMSLSHTIGNGNFIGKRSLCRLVHVSKSEICMCTHSMMDVPFKDSDVCVYVCRCCQLEVDGILDSYVSSATATIHIFASDINTAHRYKYRLR